MMTSMYRIFGSELSPYSVKVRSYCRYKAIPHEWVPRTEANREEFARLAKLPLIPLVLTPGGQVLQDSTPIIETLEQAFAEPSIHPAEPAAAMTSALLEEYGDEWVNKPMFHYRWFYEPDQISTANRIAETVFGGTGGDVGKAAEAIRARMVDRLHFVGSSPANRPVIEGSLRRLLGLLEPHLAARPYLFGGRPAFGDFGLYAQLYECATDPTAGQIMRATAPNVLGWCERMLSPSADGPFETWADLRPGLEPLLHQEVAGVFLPWSAANAAALERGDDAVSVTVDGQTYAQAAQKYHARSLAALRRRYQGLDAAARAAVDKALESTGCLAYLN